MLAMFFVCRPPVLNIHTVIAPFGVLRAIDRSMVQMHAPAKLVRQKRVEWIGPSTLPTYHATRGLHVRSALASLGNPLRRSSHRPSCANARSNSR